MSTYTDEDEQRIADAIGVDVAKVNAEHRSFEAAAEFWRSGARRPSRLPRARILGKLDRTRKAAINLLNSLGIKDLEDAYDGPLDEDVVRGLTLSRDHNEDALADATRQIGRLVEILGSVEAILDLKQRAEAGAIEEERFAELTAFRHRTEDDVMNGWVARMMEIYQRITGKEPATSTGSAGQPNEGVGSGPLIRFLQAAASPLKRELPSLQRKDRRKTKLNLGEDALRSRVRGILDDL
jgi:hypothetical protein